MNKDYILEWPKETTIIISTPGNYTYVFGGKGLDGYFNTGDKIITNIETKEIRVERVEE